MGWKEGSQGWEAGGWVQKIPVISNRAAFSPHDLLLGDISPVDIASFKVEVHGDRSLHFIVVDEQGVAFGQQVVTAQVFAVRKQQLRLVL